MRRLLVLGAGGHGRVVADAAEAAGYEEVAFLNDDPTAPRCGPYSILGPFAAIADLKGHWKAAIAAVGNNRLRLEVLNKLRSSGFETPSILHPAAILSRYARVGDGVFLGAGAIVNTGAYLGESVIVNTGATVDHDCHVEAGVHLSPGAHLAGAVTVGLCTWVGIGASVKQCVRIGQDCIVGAGAAVVSDVDDRTVVVGVPARALVRKSG